MPLISIDWIEGRSLEQKREVAKRITEAMSDVAKVPPEAVEIVFTEHSRDQFAIGGKLLVDS